MIKIINEPDVYLTIEERDRLFREWQKVMQYTTEWFDRATKAEADLADARATIESLTRELQEARQLNVELVRHLKLIEQATAPFPHDGSEHENAHTLAKQALSLNKWGVI